MRRFTKLLIGFIILVALIGIAGLFILPPVLKPILIEKLSKAVHRQAAIEKISINPYLLTLSLKGFSLKEPGQPSVFLSFDELFIDAEGIASLFKRAVVLKEIRLTRPYVSISRRDGSSYNFSDLIPKEEKREEKPFHFSLNNISIVDASIDFDDKPMKTRHTVRRMNFSIPSISNIAHQVNTYVEPRFSAVINGDPYELKGKTKPFADSRETIFDVNFLDVDVPHYLNYVPVKLNGKLSSMQLDAKMNVSFIVPKGKMPIVKLTGDIALRKIALDDGKKNKILRLPALNVTLASVDPLIPDIHLAKIFIDSPEIMVRRDKEGSINLLNLMAEEKPEKKKEPAVIGEKKPALKFLVDEVTLKSARAAFADDVPAETVTISVAPLDLKLTNLSSEKGAGQLDLTLTIEKGGRISAKGPLDISQLRAELDIAAENINIRTFQSYFADKVRINMNRGTVSTTGRLSLAQDKEGKPRIKYAGNIAVSDVATMDKAFSNDFITWKQLYFDELEAGLDPLTVNIKGISLTDFYARIVVYPDGTLNIQKIVAGTETQAASNNAQKETIHVAPAEKPVQTAKPAESILPNIKIGKVTLQGGTVDFADRHIKPNYSAKMLNIGGSITGLSSEEITRAAVDLRGNLGYGSPIEISGRINPLAKNAYIDLKVSFKDIELSPITPYSSKYLGYPITKGKLTFDVSYLIENRKLNSENKIFIDRLTFGDKVESPDAVKAPVKLAATLLADRQGRINLDIPVSGSLDDPKFKVWPIIWKVIVNLINKALTAPFTLIASLLGGDGEEMSHVEFDYGSDLLSSAAQHKIQSLAKALQERPDLIMDITGYVDTEKDKEGLRQDRFNKKIKSQKLKEITKKGEAAVPLSKIQIQPQEYEKYLALAYKDEKFPKPRNIVGLAKTLPPQETEKLMLAHIVVSDSDLRLLASRRAERIKEQILKDGQIAPGRLFVVEGQSLTPPTKEKLKSSRVEFKLK
jgi:uncharacterized protein involved in outer membrane biogenesis